MSRVDQGRTVVTMVCGPYVANRPTGGTSERLASVYYAAERRWFDTALRRRLDDGARMKWKDRFCARAVTLSATWRRARLAGA